MPRKKADNKDQITLATEPEKLTPEDGTENDLPENPFINNEQPSDTGFSLEPCTNGDGENLSDGVGELDNARDFTQSGEYSGPLDIERRLDEEIAAMNAEIAANTEDMQIPSSETADEQKSGKLPSARGSERGRRKAQAVDSKESKGNQAKDAAITVRANKVPLANATQNPENFFQMDFRHLDRDLTDLERQEWNDIYASFRSQSILTGTVVGVDQNELPVADENGKIVMRVISSLVVIGYRVKILIPENTVWMKGEERSTFLMRGMIGATVDYVIINVDREGEVALASRALAMVKRRRSTSSGKNMVQPGNVITCHALVVGARRCLLTYGGYDIPMLPVDMSYTAMLDMREVYRPGQELKARVITHHPAQQELKISVKAATSNPFDGAERRHPVGSRRQAVITAKYKGGVFCTMQDGTVCLCLYSNAHYDSEFIQGDNVIVYITQYNYRSQHIYGRIVSKW